MVGKLEFEVFTLHRRFDNTDWATFEDADTRGVHSVTRDAPLSHTDPAGPARSSGVSGEGRQTMKRAITILCPRGAGLLSMTVPQSHALGIPKPPRMKLKLRSGLETPQVMRICSRGGRKA